MTEMYQSYVQSAEALKQRIDLLSIQINSDENQDNINALKARRQLLIEERYDLIDIANSLRTGSTWGDFYWVKGFFLMKKVLTESFLGLQNLVMKKTNLEK